MIAQKKARVHSAECLLVIGCYPVDTMDFASLPRRCWDFTVIALTKKYYS